MSKEERDNNSGSENKVIDTVSDLFKNPSLVTKITQAYNNDEKRRIKFVNKMNL